MMPGAEGKWTVTVEPLHSKEREVSWPPARICGKCLAMRGLSEWLDPGIKKLGWPEGQSVLLGRPGHSQTSRA